MARVFVGNLDFDADERELRQLFEPHGPIRDVRIATDWETGHSRGFAFVDMADKSDAKKAIAELKGVELDGRELTIRFAPPVPPTGFDSLSLDG